MPKKTKFKVNARKLAFFRKLEDMDTPPKTYLKKGTVVEADMIQGEVYGGIYADKPYYRVSTSSDGTGFMLQEGLTEVIPNAGT